MRLTGLCLPLLLVSLASGAESAPTSDFETIIPPFVARNCVLCHSGGHAVAGLNLTLYRDAESAARAGAVWEKMLAKLRAGEMPPAGMPRPTREELQPVLDWLEAEVARRRKERGPDPGRVTARRLNRQEYNNTIRDLLGVDLRPADDFPADDSGYGFDNIGDVLSLSPVLMERYLVAAERVAREAIVVDRPLPVTQETFRAEPEILSNGDETWPGEFSATYEFPADATYDIRVPVKGKRPSATRLLTLELWGDNELVTSKPVRVGAETNDLVGRARVPAGEHTLRAALVEDASNVDDARGEAPGPNTRDRNFVIEGIEIKGPYDQEPPPLTASHRRIFICGERGQYDAACTGKILRNLAYRAYRRPVTGDEVDKLHGLVRTAMADGAPYEEAMQVALEAVLVSPNFLFRIERDAAPDDPKAIHRINDFELASRLSYFLWSSMPDDELLRLARLDLLHTPDVLEAQVRRMLADDRSEALVRNFAGQWLELRNLDEAQPDPALFPDFNDELREAMRRETELFFTRVMREDRSVLDFIDGKYTYLNERLAEALRHRRREGRLVPAGPARRRAAQRRADAGEHPRPSRPTRRGPRRCGAACGCSRTSSPRRRHRRRRTYRRSTTKGSASPARCASRWSSTAPIRPARSVTSGWIRWASAWRTTVPRAAGARTRASSRLTPPGSCPNGETFSSPAELKQILKANAGAFVECLTEKMLTYALGRGLESYDQPQVEAIARQVAEDDYRFSRLVLGIVRSMPFEMRRGDPGREDGS